MNDSQLENRTVKKVSFRLLPFLFICFAAAFLDRVNVGFAALQMNKALDFSSAVYGLGAGIFFIGYFTMEVPGNLIMAKVGARRWIARILITWGIISGLTAFVSTPMQFYIVRFFLGVAEASFFPGIIFYLGNWYQQKDHAKAIALFMISLPACNVIGSPLSSFLLGLTWLGLAGWKWLFILEALPSVILGIVTLLYLTDKPEQAKWLDDDQRNWLVEVLQKEKETKQAVKKYTVMQAFADRDVMKLSVAYLAWMCGYYGVIMFLPTLVKGLSAAMSNQAVGFWVALPYAVALVAMILVGRHSDRTNERRFHVVFCMAVAALGLVLSVYMAKVSVLTSMLFYALTVAGAYSAFSPFWAIPNSFLSLSAAAGGIAFINSIGNLGGFIGPYVMGYIKDFTGSFEAGALFLAGCLALCGLILLTLRKSGKAAEFAPELSYKLQA